MNGIITEQKLYLNDHYNSIKYEIQNKKLFSNLSTICRFIDDEKLLIFKTEKIHPRTIDKKSIPIMFLVTNPHPLSVKVGMFFSEKSSTLFWKRIFESKHINITATEEIESAINNWTNNTPSLLSDYLLSCSYHSRFSLFFDCLESLPTNNGSDLDLLFDKNKGREILRQTLLQRPGMNNLIEVSKNNNIKTFIVFSVVAYRKIIGENDKFAKDPPKRIKLAINKYIENGDSVQFWDSLKDFKREIQFNGSTIRVYLALYTRGKNWIANNGGRIFTYMIDQILDDILIS